MGKKECPAGVMGSFSGDMDSTSGNISYVIKECKPDYKKISDNYFFQFGLQDIAQKIISSAFPVEVNKNFCNCHSALGSFVGLKVNKKSRLSYYDSVIHCGNAFCCPVCGPRIAAYRASELRKAIHTWLNDDSENTCYLLTLTFRHFLSDSLDVLLDKFNNACKFFWGHYSVKHIFDSVVARATSLEITFGKSAGWHPHKHVLLFSKKCFFDKKNLFDHWEKGLLFSGLEGKEGISLDIIEARSCDKYLNKLACEMTFSSLKQGRGEGHYTQFQILFSAAMGESWARHRFAELFLSVKGRHTFQRSKGFNERFGLGDFSDEDIIENRAEDLSDWAVIPSEFWRFMTRSDMAYLKICASTDNRSDFMERMNLVISRANEQGKGVFYDF